MFKNKSPAKKFCTLKRHAITLKDGHFYHNGPSALLLFSVIFDMSFSVIFDMTKNKAPAKKIVLLKKTSTDDHVVAIYAMDQSFLTTLMDIHYADAAYDKKY
jgi:hypothetical protein